MFKIFTISHFYGGEKKMVLLFLESPSRSQYKKIVEKITLKFFHQPQIVRQSYPESLFFFVWKSLDWRRSWDVDRRSKDGLGGWWHQGRWRAIEIELIFKSRFVFFQITFQWVKMGVRWYEAGGLEYQSGFQQLQLFLGDDDFDSEAVIGQKNFWNEKLSVEE